MKKDFDLVQVFAGTTVQAQMVQSILKSERIEAFLKDEYMGTMFPFHTAPGAAGSVKVVVSNVDYERAKLIVDDYYKNINSDE